MNSQEDKSSQDSNNEGRPRVVDVAPGALGDHAGKGAVLRRNYEAT
jgi:hypothetical protein